MNDAYKGFTMRAGIGALVASIVFAFPACSSGGNESTQEASSSTTTEPPEEATPLSVMVDLILRRHEGLCNADAEALRDVYASETNTRLQEDLEYIRNNPDVTCTTIPGVGDDIRNFVEGTDTGSRSRTWSYDYLYVDYEGRSKWQHAELVHLDKWRIVSIQDIDGQSLDAPTNG